MSGSPSWASADLHEAVLAAEPPPHLLAPDLGRVGRVFADLADLKSPYLAGHSRGVARLAAGAGARLALGDHAVADLEVAGLLHDVGRVAVSSAVWDKPSRLTPGEWEQARLHPYHTERILSASEELSRLAPCAGRHHERLDGSGYHRGSTAVDLSQPARVLAAADRYRTLVEPRPHRPARSPDEASKNLLADARDGLLDTESVAAVLEVAGHPVDPADAAVPRRLVAAGAGGGGAGGTWLHQPRGRRAAGDLPAHRRAPRPARLRQARRVQPRRRRPFRRRARSGRPEHAAE